MVMVRRQEQIIINQFRNLSMNQKFHMYDPAVKYMLIPFEGNTSTGDSQGIELYPQSTKDIDKESDK